MPVSVRIITFNIRRDGIENDEGDFWECRRQAVLDLIKSLGAAIVGLQEVRPSQLEFLRDKLSPEYTCISEGREVDRSGEASPFFFRSSDFQVRRSQISWISATPDEPGSKSVGALCPRVVTCAELQHQSGSSLFCFNTHLDHAGLKDSDFAVQQHQAGILCSLIDRFCGDSYCPRILMGDMNSGYDVGALPVIMQAGYSDASKSDESPTFVGFDGSGSELTHVFGHTTKSVTKIDWILTKGLNTDNYVVYANRYEAANGALRFHSDHAAVGVDLVVEAVEDERASKAQKRE